MTQNYGDTLPRPFQCFMGRWEGICKTFDLVGNFLESGMVHADIYWVAEDTWCFSEHFDNLYGYGAADFSVDIKVTGKTCYGEDPMLKVYGVELTPFNYIFTVESSISKATIYNNHYFIDPNQRRILTHKLQDGMSFIYQIQDFVRVA